MMDKAPHDTHSDSVPAWEFGDYEPDVGKLLWNWAAKTTTSFRHHGVTHFATANAKHFEGFGVEKVWSQIEQV